MSKFRIEKVNSLPGTITANTVYVVQNGTFSEIYISNTAGTATRKVNINHNDSFNKQGGDGTNFYHLGEDEYNNLFNFSYAGQVWEQYIIDDSFAFGNPRVGSAFGNSVFIVGSSSSILRISQDLSSWNRYTGFTGFSDVVFGNGLFVMILTSGTLNRVRTSTDGITWTARTTPVDNFWTSVTYGNGLFVAVSSTGTSNRIMTSPDGVTWTARINPEDNTWKDVVYGNGLFVAISDDGTNRVMTSTDGVTWTARSAPLRTWSSIAYKNGLFVACNGGSTNNIMYSSDGISWTEISISGSGWNVIESSDRYFVVVGFGPTSSRKIAYSEDGITWATGSSPYDTSTGYVGLAYGNNTFIALANQTGDTVARFAFSSTTSKLINHSQLNLDDGRNPHQTRYEDLLGTPPSSDIVDYSAAWYTHGTTSLAGHTMAKNTRFYVPLDMMLYAKNDMDISKVAFRTSSSGVGGSTMRVGVYERTTLNNLSLVADFGTVSTDALFTIEFTFTAQTLTKGKLYYLVYQRDDTAGTVDPQFQSWANMFCNHYFMVAPASADMWQTNQALYKTGITIGALASTDTLPTVSSNVPTPRIQWYLS